jgi:hypothetical protein
MARTGNLCEVLDEPQALAANVPRPGAGDARYLGPARVVCAAEEDDRVFVTLEGHGPPSGVWARIALAGGHTLGQDDLVLVIGDVSSGFYVIGVLGRGSLASGPTRQMVGGGPLRCEYDPTSDKARIIVDAADLEFVSPTGSISFLSGRGIRFEGDALSLDARSSVTVRGEEVRVSGERGTVALKQATYTGDAVSAKVSRLHWFADRIESTAGVVIEHAKNVFSRVEHLSETKAGRVRMLVAATFHVKARRAVVKADEDCKVQAERIDLG